MFYSHKANIVIIFTISLLYVPFNFNWIESSTYQITSFEFAGTLSLLSCILLGLLERRIKKQHSMLYWLEKKIFIDPPVKQRVNFFQVQLIYNLLCCRLSGRRPQLSNDSLNFHFVRNVTYFSQKSIHFSGSRTSQLIKIIGEKKVSFSQLTVLVVK